MSRQITRRSRGLQRSRHKGTQCWIFQAHPKEDDLREFLKKLRRGSWFYWRVTAFKYPRENIRLGDRVAMFQARGKEPEAAGIYALGTIAELPRRKGSSWEVRVKLTHDPRIEQPISIDKMKTDKALHNLSVLRPRGAEGSNFRIKEVDAWGAILALWGEASTEKSETRAPSPDTAAVKAVAEHEMIFRERELVSTYMAHMRHKRILFEREFVVPKSPDDLKCDLFLKDFEGDRGLLIEAKGNTSRESIRTAIGQLFDYRRYFVSGSKLPRLAILLPNRLDSDLEELCSSLQIAVVWKRSDETFDDSSRGKLSRCPADVLFNRRGSS